MALDFVKYAEDPNQFDIDMWGVEPYPWQAAASNDVAKMDRDVIIQSGAGCGKTTWLSKRIIWFLVTHPLAQIPCTAPTKHHLIELLWAQIHKQVRESELLSKHLAVWQTKLAIRGYENEWFAIARTAKVLPGGEVSEGLQGFHGGEIPGVTKGFTMQVGDETTGIDDQVIAATDGTIATGDGLRLWCSNPIRTSGFFYEACTNEDLSDHYYHHKVSCLDIPNINMKYVRQMEAKYGKNSPVYLSKVLGEFPNKKGNILFDPADCRAIYRYKNMTDQEFASQYGALKIGVDIADGGDCESVACLRRGPMIQKFEAWKGADSEQNADHVVMLIQKYRPVRVYIDCIGVGTGTFAALKRRGYGGIVRQYKGTWEADDPEVFNNRRSNCYFHVSNLVGQHEVISAAPCERLIEDLSHHMQVTKDGIFAVTPKEIIRKRFPSPDFSDSWIMTYTDELKDGRHAYKTNTLIAAANNALVATGTARIHGALGRYGERSALSQSRFSRWDNR